MDRNFYFSLLPVTCAICPSLFDISCLFFTSLFTLSFSLFLLLFLFLTFRCISNRGKSHAEIASCLSLGPFRLNRVTSCACLQSDMTDWRESELSFDLENRFWRSMDTEQIFSWLSVRICPGAISLLVLFHLYLPSLFAFFLFHPASPVTSTSTSRRRRRRKSRRRSFHCFYNNN